MKNIITEMNTESLSPNVYQQEKNDPIISDRIYEHCLFIYCTNLCIQVNNDKINIIPSITIEHVLEQACIAFYDIKHLQIPNLDKFYLWMRDKNLMTWENRLHYFNGKSDDIEFKIMSTAQIEIPETHQRPRTNGKIKT